MALLPFLQTGRIEAGCDEAGRGCLAGPVVAAAVILPASFQLPGLNDSKVLSENQRNDLEVLVKEQAVAWAIGVCSESEIDRYNILQASIRAMHKAVDQLMQLPEFLLIDGKFFKPHRKVSHACVIRGDGKFASIAAASVLAKTHRDRFMRQLHAEFPQYGWSRNMGYPTAQHRAAIQHHGITRYHRQSFKLYPQIEQEPGLFTASRVG